MPTWLIDPPRSLYIILILGIILPVAAALFFVRPASRRDKVKPGKKFSRRAGLLALSGLSALLLIGLYTCDSLYESDREQIVRNLREIHDGVDERDLNKVFRHVSERFRYGSSGKQKLREIATRARDAGTVEKFIVWDVGVVLVEGNPNQANVQFRFKVIGPLIRENQFIAQSIWERTPAGQWQIVTFHVFPATGTSDEFYIPGI